MPLEDEAEASNLPEHELQMHQMWEEVEKARKVEDGKTRNFEWNRFVVITILTMTISAVWIATFVARLAFHWSTSTAPTLDAAMLLVLGYWFSTAARKDKNDDKQQ